MDKSVNQQLADKMNEKMNLNKIILDLKVEIETYQKEIDEKNGEIRGITSLLNTKKALLKKKEDFGKLIDVDIKNLAAKAGGGKKRRRKKQSKRRSKKHRSKRYKSQRERKTRRR